MPAGKKGTGRATRSARNTPPQCPLPCGQKTSCRTGGCRLPVVDRRPTVHRSLSMLFFVLVYMRAFFVVCNHNSAKPNKTKNARIYMTTKKNHRRTAAGGRQSVGRRAGFRLPTDNWFSDRRAGGQLAGGLSATTPSDIDRRRAVVDCGQHRVPSRRRLFSMPQRPVCRENAPGPVSGC